MSQVLDIPKENVRFVETALKVSGDTIEFSFMSREPVSRPFGNEILDPKGCDFTRMNSGAVQWLWSHDPSQVLGAVERGWLVGTDKGMCRVRFGAGPTVDQYGENIRSGIISNVSFKYSVDEFKLLPNGDVLVTQFTPLEISSVSIPADPTVGIGRSFYSQKGDLVMPSQARRIAEQERIRTLSIKALGETYAPKFGSRSIDLANSLIDCEAPIEQARSEFLEMISYEQKPIAAPLDYPGMSSGSLGLGGNDLKNYSLSRAILYAGNLISEREAAHEIACSKELARSRNIQSRGVLIPTDALVQQRGFQVGTPSAGGNLVETSLDSANFIDILRIKTACIQAGAKMMNGLVGNVSVPRRSTSSNTFWVSEDQDIGESTGTFDQITLSPKQLCAMTRFSHLMLLQSTPDIESLVTSDFGQLMAVALDAAILTGSGTAGQPRGILNTAGIGSIALGTNGGAITYDNIVDLENALSVANALDPSCSYITNSKVITALKKLKETTGAPIWVGPDAGYAPGTPATINGYRIFGSNNVPSNLTKGTGTNLSAVFFGNFSDILVGNWGTLEILVNPYIGDDFSKGRIAVRAMLTVDLAIRQAKSFAVITDAIA